MLDLFGGNDVLIRIAREEAKTEEEKNRYISNGYILYFKNCEYFKYKIDVSVIKGECCVDVAGIDLLQYYKIDFMKDYDGKCAFPTNTKKM